MGELPSPKAGSHAVKVMHRLCDPERPGELAAAVQRRVSGAEEVVLNITDELPAIPLASTTTKALGWHGALGQGETSRR